MMNDVEIPSSVAGSILHVGMYDLPTVRVIVITVLILHCALSAITVRLSSRRHLGGATLHFAALTWMTMLTAEFTVYVIDNFISVG